MFKDHYSNNHLVTNVEKLLFEQNLTLISTEIKITGMIRYDKSFCPWPGCLLQSKRGLPQSSHSLLDGIKHWGTSLKLWHAESISWGIGYGITLLVSSLIVDPLLTLTSCSAVTVVDVAELDSPDVDGDTVLTGPRVRRHFQNTKKKLYADGGKRFSTSTVYRCHFFWTALGSCSRKVHLSSAHDNTPWG